MPSIQVPVSSFRPDCPSISQYNSSIQPQVQFTRQLWQRSEMSSDVDEEEYVRGPTGTRIPLRNNSITVPIAEPDTVASHVVTDPSRRSPSTTSSDVPLAIARQSHLRPAPEQEADQTELTRSRNSSEGSYQPCLCRDDPKIPRPRNGKHISLVEWDGTDDFQLSSCTDNITIPRLCDRILVLEIPTFQRSLASYGETNQKKSRKGGRDLPR